jgi:hypothetical protein
LLLDARSETTGDRLLTQSELHVDMKRIVALFGEHSNVKLCLSGHIHLHERLDYNGVTYLCNGAVSGAWWAGSYRQTPPGYCVLDLFADGSFSHQYLAYDCRSTQTG